MTWFKVDDRLPTHRKVMSIPRGARRVAAVGAWTLCGAWVAGNNNNGHLPSHVLDDFGIPARAATDLVEAGLWLETEGGYIYHDYLDYNPSGEQVAADRAAAAERQRRAREKARMSRRDSRVSHAHVTPDVTDPRHGPPDPTRPDPKDQTPSVSEPRKRGRPKTGPPDDLMITPEMSVWGRENAPLISDPSAETRRFLDHARANGKTFSDWSAAWRTWMSNAQRYAERDGVSPASKRVEPAWMR